MKNLKEFVNHISKNYNNKNVVFGENKAIFVVGGPGSGKDIVVRQILSMHNIMEMNQNQIHILVSDKENRHNKSKSVYVESIQKHQPILINGPADDSERMFFIKEKLECLGYNSLMVFVSTTNDISKYRNENLSRVMNENVRYNKWSTSQKNKKIFKDVFENFIEIDNNQSIDYIIESSDLTLKRINKFLSSESYKKNSNVNTVIGPSDITPDNRPNEVAADDIKYNSPKRNKDYIFKTYSEESKEKMIVFPEPKTSNFSQDKETKKKKGLKDSPTINQRMRNTTGIGPEYDTRQQGTVYPMSGLGDVTYRESIDFRSFRNKMKESIDSPGEISMGVGGVLGGSTNKEPMQSYNDSDKKIGIKITKKGKQNVQQ